MADTTAARNTVATLLADNTTQDISPADVRAAHTGTLDVVDTLSSEVRQFEAVALSANRTLAAADSGKVLVFSAAATLTVPTGLPVGFACTIVQRGTGTVTVAAGAGATVGSAEGLYRTSAQYAVASILVVEANVAVLSGDLVA